MEIVPTRIAIADSVNLFVRWVIVGSFLSSRPCGVEITSESKCQLLNRLLLFLILEAAFDLDSPLLELLHRLAIVHTSNFHFGFLHSEQRRALSAAGRIVLDDGHSTSAGLLNNIVSLILPCPD